MLCAVKKNKNMIIRISIATKILFIGKNILSDSEIQPLKMIEIHVYEIKLSILEFYLNKFQKSVL